MSPRGWWRFRLRAGTPVLERTILVCESHGIVIYASPRRLHPIVGSSASVLGLLLHLGRSCLGAICGRSVSMRHIKLAGLLAVALVLGACGNSSSNPNSSINGNWSATLLDVNGRAVLGFTTALSSIGTGELTVTNFKFTTSSPCFGSGSTETGGFGLSGTSNGMAWAPSRFTFKSGGTVQNGRTR